MGLSVRFGLACFAVAWALAFPPRVSAQKKAADEKAADLAPVTQEAITAYLHAPQKARDLVTVLRKFEIKIEGGIAYADFRRSLEEVRPDVVLFAESNEARTVPELAFVMSNACRCYLAVSQLWNQELFERDPGQKFNAGMGRLKLGGTLFKAASDNIGAAKVLADTTSDERQIREVIANIASNRDRLAAKTNVQTANRIISGESIRVVTKAEAEAEDAAKAAAEKTAKEKPAPAENAKTEKVAPKRRGPVEQLDGTDTKSEAQQRAKKVADNAAAKKAAKRYGPQHNLFGPAPEGNRPGMPVPRLAPGEAEERAEATKRAAEEAKQQKEEEAKARAPQFRLWTESETGRQIKGKFRGVIGDSVKIQTENGDTIRLKTVALSEEDRAYIRQRAKP